MKKKKFISVLKEIPWERLGSWSRGNGWINKPSGFTIAYCYPKKGEPFIVKGGSHDVEMFLSKECNTKGPFLAHHTIFYHGKPRRILEFYNCGIPITFHSMHFSKLNPPTREFLNKNFWISLTLGAYGSGIHKVKMYFKRVPRAWPKGLSQYV